MCGSQKCSSLNLYGCSFLVHVVQSVLRWGKDPIVVVKREEGSKYKATGRTNQQPLKKRKSRQDTKEDKLFHVIVNISMRKMILEVEFLKSMIYEILKIFRRITYLIPR